MTLYDVCKAGHCTDYLCTMYGCRKNIGNAVWPMPIATPPVDAVGQRIAELERRVEALEDIMGDRVRDLECRIVELEMKLASGGEA